MAKVMAFALGEMGLRDQDFWDLTPYELHRRIVGWNRLQEANRKRTMYGSWHTAAFQRAKRMPSLMRLLRPMKTKVLKAEEAERHEKKFQEMAQRAGVPIYDGKEICRSTRSSAPPK
jgi:hypothetical protein